MLTEGKKGCFWGILLAMTVLVSLFATANTWAVLPNHYITVTQTVNGKITPTTTSGQVAVPEGANKLFTVTPKTHYHVASITVDSSSLDLNNPDGVILIKTGNVYKYLFTNVITDTHIITATYAIDTFSLTASSIGSGTGTITGSGINFPGDNNETFDYGTPVALTATADAGSIFEGWSGACLGKNTTCTVTVTKAKTAVAKFTKTYALNITKAGSGSGTVKSLPGINCGSDCNEVYKDGKVLTLTAIPDSASSFTGWSDAYTSTSKTLKVTMDGDKAITATFGPKADGMKIAEKVSVVDTNSSPQPVKALTIGRLLALPNFPADSDYNKDQTMVYVNERSAEAFRTVNEILCMVGQTQYDAMVNKGNYKAQIDTNLCSSNNDDPSSAGEGSQDQSSGSTMPKYEMWTVNSSRVDNNSPQILKAWIHESQEPYGDEPGRAIFAKVVITEPVTETNPYGIFTIYWKMLPEVDGTIYPVIMGRGILKTEKDSITGKVLLEFVEFEDFDIPQGLGHVTRTDEATLDRAADGSSGGGTAHHYRDEPWMSSPEDETFNFAFNPSYFLRTNGVNTFCLDRTDFDETAWRYGMYDLNGTRINRNSAYSIKITQGGKNYYGSIGYYGIWFPKEVILNNGDQVYKMDFGPGSGAGEPYNVLISDGKLKKHVRKEMILGAIKNVPLDYWDSNDQKNYRVKWNGTNFMKVEWLNQSSNNFLWETLDPPVIYDISSLNWDTLNFWSQSLGGNVQIKLNCSPPAPTFSCTADDNVPVVFYAENVVFPSDTVPASFACFDNCPDVSKINSLDPWPFNNQYGQPQDVPPALAQYLSYDFNSTQMLLTDGVTPVIATNPFYQSGIMSGPLFEPTPGNLGLLACDWDPNKTCGWQAWNKLPVFYTWETGPNNWNKFTALKSPVDNSVLTFDPPLQVSYVHTWDDLTTSTFNLEYSGFGNLWGIPGKCIDWDTGVEVNCGPDTRWIPQFSIPSGAEVTDVLDGVTNYYVKPLEEEQRMKQKDASVCATLSTTTYPLPNISEWHDPSIGTEPVVEGPPAVIGGVLQF